MSAPDVGAPLAGRRALVTGGSSGIGRATVERLARDGAAVAINYVGSSESADGLAAELTAAGAHAVAVAARRLQRAAGPGDVL